MTSLPRTALLGLVLIATTAVPAFADVTAFLGFSPTPKNHSVRGAAFGIGLLVVGFEGEYAQSSERPLDKIPGLKTYQASAMVQTPTPKAQLYAIAGGGLYRESVGTTTDSNLVTSIGGGVKANFIGPLRLRIDYRVMRLRGKTTDPTVQRFYAGLNLKF
jgi:hypothetical protein